MPFKKEFKEKLEPIREIGFILSDFKNEITYSEIKVTYKNGVYTARVGFQPVLEKDREAITNKISGYMQKKNWEKE
ncbi:MAG TPA: hypothetical protein VKM55_27365 [Candidatus Lokiarchaeia archaeon]|nr:hypothetical protein [Candidatus Lokiarchaeia archaeon]